MTPTKPDAPREYWLNQQRDDNGEYLKTCLWACNLPDGEESIHVIEFASYQALLELAQQLASALERHHPMASYSEALLNWVAFKKESGL